ncbi:MAG TPA: BrnT family toxin [Thermoanaerobaculia bacterium]|nr:BrnT family toxin [Thermoanaerobaculia bacterium]
MKFVWDATKARANLRKHEVTFDESVTIFGDPFSLLIADPDHSESEKRLLLLGTSDRGRILVVSHVLRGETIRIISVRRAERRERRRYEEGRED